MLRQKDTVYATEPHIADCSCAAEGHAAADGVCLWLLMETLSDSSVLRWGQLKLSNV